MFTNSLKAALLACLLPISFTAHDINTPINEHGTTQLMQACQKLFTKKSKITDVTHLLNNGANINAQDHEGNTILHHIFCDSDILIERSPADNLFIIDFLLKHGANPDITNNKQETPLLCMFTYDNMIQWITSGKTSAIDNMLHYIDPASHELKNSKLFVLDCIKLFLEHSPNLNIVDRKNCTLLHHICNPLKYQTYDDLFSWLTLEIITLLLEHGADPNIVSHYTNYPQSTDNSPLSFIVEKSNEDTSLHKYSHKIIIKMFEFGANPNLRINDYRSEITPLHKMFLELPEQENIDLKLLKIMLEHGADPNAYDDESSTPLVIAACQNDLQAVKMLLDYGGDPTVGTDRDGGTILHGMASRANTEMFLLMFQHGADMYLDAEDCDGTTPLIHACDDNNLDAVKILLEAGANPNQKTSWMHLTPLLAAALHTSEHTEIIKLLIEHGAHPKDAYTYGSWGFYCTDPELKKYLSRRDYEIMCNQQRKTALDFLETLFEEE